MISEAFYRIAAGCLLLFHFAMLTRAAWRSDSSQPRLGWQSAARLVLTGTWFALAFTAILYPPALFDNFEMFPAVRWLSTLPVVAGTFFGTWALRSRLDVDSSGGVVAEGAYRWCRYPYDGAMGMYILGMGVFISNYLVMASSILIFFAMRLLVPWEQEKRRQQHFGASYLAYAAASGVFLPSVECVPQKEYAVPSRFGMTAILGLLTTLAIIFGALNYSNARPPIYLFISAEIVGICLAQIFLSTAARSGSALTGALILPICAYMMMHIPRFDPLVHLAILGSLLALGALLGYCVGALAAGFFLVMDLIESLVTSNSKEEFCTPLALDEPLPATTEHLRYKELKARIVNRA
jgi:protein-S-isoprenylcysteine O-methyltransferase Ste14